MVYYKLLSKQCLEGFELTKRELLQQFHLLSLSTLTGSR
jgi:hypothetical protein